MSYATTANRPNPVAALGALGIPAGVGVLLIVGLAVTHVVAPPDKPFEGRNIEVKIDPIIEPDPVEQKTQRTNSQVTAPEPKITVPTSSPNTWEPTVINDGAISTLPGLDDGIGGVGPVEINIPPPPPSFDPVSAAPRGNPGGWITNNDYRASWINRGMEGVASFTLNVDTNGRVSNCAITGSTGYSHLDTATCRLLTSRARFTPARDSSGAIVAGTYSSSVAWEIP